MHASIVIYQRQCHVSTRPLVLEYPTQAMLDSVGINDYRIVLEPERGTEP